MTPLNPFQTSVAEWYHEETKYTNEGLRREALAVPAPDPARQPVPFKQIDLPGVPLTAEGLPFRRPSGSEAPGGEELARISRLLWHTYGCTRLARFPGGFHPFRAAPSAGAMYPTEMYVALRGIEGVPDGLYDYQLLDHSLAPVRGEDPFPEIVRALGDHPAPRDARAAVLLTAEWYRSSWRYRERAYRRCLLDTGHVLGNLVAAAPEAGFSAVPFGCFEDGALERLLGISPTDEGVLAVVPLLDADAPATNARPPVRASAATEWRVALAAVGDRLPKDAPERAIVALHLASAQAADAPAADRSSWPAAPERDEEHGIPCDAEPTEFPPEASLFATIAARRSTRAFAPGPVDRDALFRAIAYSEPEAFPALFVPELLRTWFVAVDVVGVPPGSYGLEGRPRRLIERDRRDFREELQHLGLNQEIFTNAAGALIHTVDLPRAVALLGDRAYRLAKLDAGHIGQRLNLALLKEGIGVSGCGGYLDDEMNRVLAIPENQAVIYITVLGVPGEATAE